MSSNEHEQFDSIFPQPTDSGTGLPNMNSMVLKQGNVKIDTDTKEQRTGP